MFSNICAGRQIIRLPLLLTYSGEAVRGIITSSSNDSKFGILVYQVHLSDLFSYIFLPLLVASHHTWLFWSDMSRTPSSNSWFISVCCVGRWGSYWGKSYHRSSLMNSTVLGWFHYIGQSWSLATVSWSRQGGHPLSLSSVVDWRVHFDIEWKQ